MNEYLFKSSTCNLEVFDLVLSNQLMQESKHLGQLKAFLITQLVSVLYRATSFSLHTIHLLQEWQTLEHKRVQRYCTLRLLFCLLQSKSITLTIMLFQVSWSTITYESPIDHDSNLITELLSFVHSMSCQKHRGILQLPDHLQKTSSRDRVHTSSRFIKEFQVGLKHESLSTRQLSLVSSTQITGFSFCERIQIQGLFNQSLAKFSIFFAKSFESSNKI